jgi:hypothetical protein
VPLSLSLFVCLYVCVTFLCVCLFCVYFTHVPLFPASYSVIFHIYRELLIGTDMKEKVLSCFDSTAAASV